MNFLPLAIYENRIEPTLEDSFYVVPESDAVVADQMVVTDVSGRSFTAGGYPFSWTGSVGHVGVGAHANAYDSLAAYYAVKMIPKHGWTQHDRRKDVFFRTYYNKKLTPVLRRIAYIQIDHRDGNFVMLGHFAGQGVNMLAELSESFSVEANDTSCAFKIRDFLNQADAIILASYAMNITKEAALQSAAQFRSVENLNRGARE